MTEQDFSECSLWPIRVHLPEGVAYALWGSGGEETDLLLAVDQRLRSFVRWPSLAEFVHQGTPCNLSELAGYQLLRTKMDQPGNRVPESIHEYPFVRIGTWLAAEPRTWSAAMRSATVDCLNLLWDAAGTLGNREAQAMLRRDVAPLGQLMDALTFADDEAFRTSSAQAISSGAVAEYDRVLGLVSDAWDILS